MLVFTVIAITLKDMTMRDKLLDNNIERSVKRYYKISVNEIILNSF